MRGAIKSELLTAVFTALALLVPLTTPSVAYAQAGAVGYVKSMSPTVFIRQGSGAQVPAKVGDVLSPGSTVVTGAVGKVDLLFADGLQISLGKESVLRIDDYRFEAENPRAGRANIALLSGRMSLITGAIHTENPTGLRLSAGTGTISILSKNVTAFVVEVDPDEKRRPGWAAVTVGAIAVQTPSGRISQIAADQFARWRDGEHERELEPLPLAAAPAVLQAQVTASRATIAEVSQPVDVQSASVQAALMLSQAKAQGPASSMTTTALSGQLNMVSGDVQMRSPSGAQSQARVGDTFGPGTTFLTGRKGEVGLLFSEGHYAALGEKSVLRIADSGTRQADRASLALTEGRLSLVTWAYAGEAPVPLNVGVGNALISILSKGVVAYVVEVDSETKDAGSAAVTAGIISVKTPAGPPLAVSADKYTSWKPEQPPVPLGALAGAPAALQLAFADTIAPVNAEVAAEVASLPPTAAGPVPAPQPAAPQPTAEPLPQPQPPVALATVIVPPVAPGGGGGCTGSPC